MRLAAGHEERGGYERQAHQHRQSLFQLGGREDRSDDGGFDIHNDYSSDFGAGAAAAVASATRRSAFKRRRDRESLGGSRSRPMNG